MRSARLWDALLGFEKRARLCDALRLSLQCARFLNEHDFANAMRSSLGCARVLKTRPSLRCAALVFAMRSCFKNALVFVMGCARLCDALVF